MSLWRTGGALAGVLLAALTADASEALRPLPGQKPCPYPKLAKKRRVAGLVTFTAQVRADGQVGSVEVEEVPEDSLGFEDAVRRCVSQWRFEPSSSGEGLRPFAGSVRYRLDRKGEDALRRLMEGVAAAWNANDGAVLDGIQAELAPGAPTLRDRLQRERADADWRIELEPELGTVRFDGFGTAMAEQRLGGAPASARARLSITAVQERAGWRLVTWSPLAGPKAPPASGEFTAPRLKKHAAVRLVEIPDARRAAAVLEFEVSVQGRAREIRVLWGPPKFSEAAVRAVEQWEFEPARMGGVAVPSTSVSTFTFQSFFPDPSDPYSRFEPSRR